MKLKYYIDGREGLKQYSMSIKRKLYFIYFKKFKIITGGVGFYGSGLDGKLQHLFAKDVEKIHNKILSKMYSFYQVLMGANDESNYVHLYDTVVNSETELGFGWDGGQEMGSYHIHDGEEIDGKMKVYFGYNQWQSKDNLPLTKEDKCDSYRYGILSYPEFYMLMQLYYGVYKNTKLEKKLRYFVENGLEKLYEKELDEKGIDKIKKEIKELLLNKETMIRSYIDIFKNSNENSKKKLKENRFKLDSLSKKNIKEDIKNHKQKILESEKELKENINLQEELEKETDIKEEKWIKILYSEKNMFSDKKTGELYYKLMQKDTTLAFDGLKIEKIYDKEWSEEEQMKKIEEVNKEYGEEVLFLE